MDGTVGRRRERRRLKALVENGRTNSIDNKKALSCKMYICKFLGFVFAFTHSYTL